MIKDLENKKFGNKGTHIWLTYENEKLRIDAYDYGENVDSATGASEMESRIILDKENTNKFLQLLYADGRLEDEILAIVADYFLETENCGYDCFGAFKQFCQNYDITYKYESWVGYR